MVRRKEEEEGRPVGWSAGAAGPRRWNHMELRSGNLQITGDGVRVTYTGKGLSDQDAASVRTDRPFDLASAACHYFEVTVVHRGRDGYIGVGVCSGSMDEAVAASRSPDGNEKGGCGGGGDVGAEGDVGAGGEGGGRRGSAGVGASSSAGGGNVSPALSKQLGRLPGWEATSWGYHGDDGFKFHGSGTGTNYGPQYSTGDVAGCLYNAVDGTLAFTKNGIELGVAFTGVSLPMAASMAGASKPGTHGRLRRVLRLPLYPMVGLRTPGECVEANFGERPFVFDFAGYVAAAKERVLGQVARMRLPEYLSLGSHERRKGERGGVREGADAMRSVAGEGGVHSSPSRPARSKKSKPSMDVSTATEVASAPMETDDASRGSGGGGGGSEDTTTRGIASMGINPSAQPSVSFRGVGGAGPHAGDSQPLMPSLVLEYLLVHGHRRSAMALATAARLEVSEDMLRDCSARRAVMELAMAGDIDGARAAAEAIVPGLFLGRPDLAFLLGCQKFVELVRAGNDEATLAFGQELGRVDRDEVERCASNVRRITHAGDGCVRSALGFPSVNEKLEQIFSLLAYSPPEAAPLGYILDLERRAEAANSLNVALLWAQGRSPSSSLDTLDRQIRVARMVLGEVGSSATSLIDVDSDFFGECGGSGVTN